MNRRSRPKAAGDDADVLWRIWPQLDSRTRQLLEDKYVLNMSDAEIASALGVKPSSVRMLLTRARSKARKAIEKKMRTKLSLIYKTGKLLYPSYI